MQKRAVRIAVVVVALWAAVLKAQVTTGTGTISGTVTDTSGAVLPGVKIEIVNEGTGVSRSVVSDAAGRYAAPSLGVGNYHVTGSLEGFQTEVRSGIELTVGREAIVDIKLGVGAVSQTVEVTGEAPLVQTTESTVSYTVADRTMQDLPLNGRDMSQLILLSPGITQSTIPGGQAFSGYGRRFSISGMRGEDNIYLLDGGLIGDFRRHIPAGPSGSLLGLETTQEFEVLTSSLGAQYGRSLGGVFNAVSKSGTNQWHGDAYDYLRNNDLDANNFFDLVGITYPFRRNQFGGTFGGPIKKDKTFFFVAYEGTRESLSIPEVLGTITGPARQGILPTGTVAVNPIIVPYLNQYPLPTAGGTNFGNGTAQFTFPFTQPTDEDFGQVRIDHQFSSSDTFFARYSGSNSTRTTPGSAGAFPGYVQISSLGSSLFTMSETHVFSPTILNTARFHFDRVYPLDSGTAPPVGPGITIVPGQPYGPEVSPGSGVSTFGGAGFDTNPVQMISNRFNYQDDVNLTRGSHSLQFGGFLERFQLNSIKPNRAFGVWSFNSLALFLAGTVNTFRGAIPGYGTYRRGFRNWSFPLYIQDAWRISPKVTLNLGVRWEPYSVPTEVNGLISNLRNITDSTGTVGSPYWINKSWRDVAPRVGIAWSPFASGKTSVRAGFGEFYEPNDPNFYYNQMDREPPFGYDFTLPDGGALGQFPNAAAEIAASPFLSGPAYSLNYSHNMDSHALQYNLNIQQQLGANNMVSVGYAGSRGIDLLSLGDINMPAAVYDGLSLAFPATAKLVNPNFPSALYWANNTSSWYNGLLLTYQRRFSHGFQGQVSYTYSKATAQTDVGQNAAPVTGGGGRMKYPDDAGINNGLSGYDFRNVLSVSYSYDLPFAHGMKGILGRFLSGWQTSGVVSARNGNPADLSSGVSTALTALAVGVVSPNSVLGCGSPENVGNPNQYINLSCFTPPGSRELGNLGRNTLITPGAVTWDPSLIKKFPLRERLNLEFRAEMFNVLNHPNFGQPSTSLFTATGGAVGGAGQITTTATTSREIQFALKLLW